MEMIAWRAGQPLFEIDISQFSNSIELFLHLFFREAPVFGVPRDQPHVEYLLLPFLGVYTNPALHPSAGSKPSVAEGSFGHVNSACLH